MLYGGEIFKNEDFRNEVTLNLLGFVRKNLIPSEGCQSFGVSLRPEHSTEFLPKSQAEGKNQHSGWGVEELILGVLNRLASVW
jgi:hypothetical protein